MNFDKLYVFFQKIGRLLNKIKIYGNFSDLGIAMFLQKLKKDQF
jgi:hypothetical protein